MTDAEIVAAVLHGEGKAYEELIRRYQNLIYGLAYHYVGSFEDARDIAQESFIQAFVGLRELREPEKFGAWLKKLAVNRCRMHRRQIAARPAEPLSERHEALAATEGSYSHTEHRLLIDQALSCLSQSSRLTVTLFYFQSYSLQEIAEFLEVPVSTVMSRLRNARTRLRKEWMDMTEEVIGSNRLPEDFAQEIPIPYDEYDLTAIPATLSEPVWPFRKQLVLSAFAQGSSIVEAKMEGYDWQTHDLAKPVRVTVKTPDGMEHAVHVQMSNRIKGIETEAKLLPVLARLGLPAPEVIAGPASDPAYPCAGQAIVTTILPGRTVEECCEGATKNELAAAVRLTLDAVARIQSLTEPMLRESVAKDLPANTLSDELQGVVNRGGPWLQTQVFADAIRALRPVVEAVETPLVFSNGCYNAHLFLIQEPLGTSGLSVTGFTGFIGSCFEDPHIGFAKYWTYDWPLRKMNLVERYLYEHHLSRKEFAPRVAIRCLTTLQREVPVSGHETAYASYRTCLLGLLQQALQDMA